MSGPAAIDEARVEAMAEPMMRLIRDHYLRGPAGRDRVFEVLNALAFCAATTIAGTDSRVGRRDARRFLDAAIEQNVTHLVRHGIP